MALEIKQQLKLSQQLIMTPQLQQAIKLLQLTRMELQEAITQEMTENPVLEEGEEGPSEPETEAEQEANSEQETLWEKYLEEGSSQNLPSLPGMKEAPEDLPSFENALVKTTSLEEHLMWQLSMIPLQPEEKKLGTMIVGNLSDSGYFDQVPLETLAQEAAIPLEDAEAVLQMIQQFDPLGVAARNLSECLLVQAKVLKLPSPWVEPILKNHLGHLEKKNYLAIAKALGTSLEQVMTATRWILELNPKPGRAFQSTDTQYISPDIFVYQLGKERLILLNDDGIPKLRLSPYYQQVLLKSKKEKNTETKDYVQDKVRSALWLIKAIHNRQRTLYRVMEAILKRQEAFFEKGPLGLKPLILKDIAEDVGMHESTISRATTHKFVHTPFGIFELKYFFNSSLPSHQAGPQVASEVVREKMKQLIQRENPKKPYSDQKLAQLLQAENIEIARRTVTKYREELGILASSQRKRLVGLD